MRRGMELVPALLVTMLIGLMVIGFALYYGTNFFRDVGDKIQGFQTCDSGIISTLGGDEGRCSADSRCDLGDGKTWQPIGKGWGCQGQKAYCCLSVKGNGVSNEELEEASCQDSKAGDIVLVANDRCLKEGETARVDDKLGVRIYMPQYRAPCTAEVQLRGLTVMTKRYEKCGGDTALGYDKIFDDKKGFDLLRAFNAERERTGEGDACVDLTTLNSGADLYVVFKGAGPDQKVEEVFHLDTPDNKACANTAASRCIGRIEGERVSNAGSTYTDQVYILNNDGTCSLSAEKAPGSNADLVKYCSDDLQYVGPKARGKSYACEWVKTPPCYVDYGNALMGKDYFLCEQSGTYHTCTQKYVEEEEALKYPECTDSGLGDS